MHFVRIQSSLYPDNARVVYARTKGRRGKTKHLLRAHRRRPALEMFSEFSAANRPPIPPHRFRRRSPPIAPAEHSSQLALGAHRLCLL